jgi:type I restriction enzyme S subunit
MTLTRIGLGNFRQIPFPLPPLAEQRRIVDKVDKLMALCDQLETSLAIGDETRRCLLDALIAGALAPGEMQQQAA